MVHVINHTEELSEMKVITLIAILFLSAIVVMGAAKEPDGYEVVCDGELVLKGKDVFIDQGVFSTRISGKYVQYTPKPGQTCKLVEVFDE